MWHWTFPHPKTSVFAAAYSLQQSWIQSRFSYSNHSFIVKALIMITVSSLRTSPFDLRNNITPQIAKWKRQRNTAGPPGKPEDRQETQQRFPDTRSSFQRQSRSCFFPRQMLLSTNNSLCRDPKPSNLRRAHQFNVFRELPHNRLHEQINHK